jgi:hypothetical protein
MSQHRLGVRFAWPFLSFRVSVPWEVMIEASNCPPAEEVKLEVNPGEKCPTCVVSRSAVDLPVTLTVAPDPGIDVFQRRVSWMIGGFLKRSEVEVRDSFLLRTEPAWRWGQLPIMLMVLVVAVSWFAVRREQDLGDDQRATAIELGVIDELGRVPGIVRLRLFAFRRIHRREHADQLVSLQYFAAGPLVVREFVSSGSSGFVGRTLRGRDLNAADVEIRKIAR